MKSNRLQVNRENKAQHQLSAWIRKDTIICNRSDCRVLGIKEAKAHEFTKKHLIKWRLQTTIPNTFPPFFRSQSLFCFVCFAVQIRHKHFPQNKPYCFHVTYVINWLLLLLTQIIAGVSNAEIGKCFTIESNFYIIKSTTKIDENFPKKCSICIFVDKNWKQKNHWIVMHWSS